MLAVALLLLCLEPASDPRGADTPTAVPWDGPSEGPIMSSIEHEPETRQPPPQQKSDERKETKKKKKKKKKKSKRDKWGNRIDDKLWFNLGGRVMTGWELEDKRPAADQEGSGGRDYGFFLRQARAKFRLNYTDRFAVRLSVELADALDAADPNRIPYLRNAFMRVRFHDAVRLNFGHFKRPFSRLELRTPRKLSIRGRGLANSRIVEDRNYGDRSVGGMLWGRIRTAKIRWYAGAFQPGFRAKGIDAVGRLQVDPFKWFSVGGGGGYKRIENGIGQNVDVGSISADARFRVKGLFVLGDLVMGRDYLVPGEPWALGVVGLARYSIDLPKQLVLQPVASTEWADANIEVSQNDALRIIGGVNLIWRKRYRIMPQVELIRPLGTIGNPWIEGETYYVMLSLEI